MLAGSALCDSAMLTSMTLFDSGPRRMKTPLMVKFVYGRGSNKCNITNFLSYDSRHNCHGNILLWL